MMICDIALGRDGNKWVAILSYPTGKVTEFRENALEDVLLAITKEVDNS